MPLSASEVSIILRAQDQASAQIAKVNAELTKIGPSSSAASTALNSAGSALGKLAQVGAAAGIVAVGTALAGSATAAAKFEQSISNIGAVAGASATQMSALSAKALELGKATAYSATEAAAGMEELIKAGVGIQDVLGGGAAAALSLAAAGGVEVAEAATIMSTAMNTFGVEGAKAAHVADVLAGAANASATDIHQLGFGLSAVGAVAATVGVSFEDTATALAVLAQNGLKGSDAGTSLKTMLLNLSPSSKSAIGAMRELGLITADGANQFFDAEGKAKSLAEISGVLQGAIGHLTKEQQLNALQTIFGTDAVRAAAIMAKGGSEAFAGMADAMGKVTAEAVGAERLNNLAGDIEQLKGSLETAAITLGMLFLPALRSLAQDATKFVNQAITSIQELPDAFRTVQQVMNFEWSPDESLTPFINAVGTLAIAFRDKLLPVITDVINFFKGLPQPVKDAAAGFSVAMGAILAFSGVMSALAPVFAIVAGGLAILLSPIGAVALAVGLLYAAWQTNLGGIQEKTAEVLAIIGPAFSTLAGIIQQAFGGDIQGAITAFLGLLSTVAAQLAPIIAGWAAEFATFGAQVVTWLSAQVALIDWAAIWAGAVGIATALAAFIATQAVDFATWLAAQVALIPWATVWAAAVDIATALTAFVGGLVVDFATWLAAQVALIPWATIWAAAVSIASAFNTWVLTQTLDFTAWLTAEVGKIIWATVWAPVTGKMAAAAEPVFTADLATLSWYKMLGAVATGAAEILKWLTDAIAAVNWTTLGESTGALLVDMVVAAIKLAFASPMIVTAWLTGTTSSLTSVTWSDAGKVFKDLFIAAVTAEIQLTAAWASFIAGVGTGIASAMAQVDLVAAGVALAAAFGKMLISAWEEAKKNWIPTLPTLPGFGGGAGGGVRQNMSGQTGDSIVPGGAGGFTQGGTHQGGYAADISAPRGTAIRAPVGGTSSAYLDPKGGNATILKGDDGNYYYLAHGEVPFVGGRVEAGQQIGQVGNTGNAQRTEPHLHISVSSGGANFPGGQANLNDPNLLTIRPAPGASAPSGSYQATGPGGFANNEERLAFVRATAAKYGHDPETVARVARGEGAGAAGQVGDSGSSFGALQANVNGGMGTTFQNLTGLDPRDPNNEKALVDWQISQLGSTGWGPYKAAPVVGVSPWQGINTRPQSSNQTMPRLMPNGEPWPMMTGTGSTDELGNVPTSLEELIRVAPLANEALTALNQGGTLQLNTLSDEGSKSIVTLGDNIITTTRDASGNLIETTTNLQGQVIAQYATMANGATLQANSMQEGVLTSVTALGDGTLTTMRDLSGNVITTATDLSGNVVNQWTTMAGGLATAATDMATTGSEQVAALATAVDTGFAGMGQGAILSAQALEDGVLTRFIDMNGSTVDTVTDMSGRVTSQITQMADGTVLQANGMQEGVRTSVTDMGTGTMTIVKDLEGSMVTTMTDLNGNVVNQWVTMKDGTTTQADIMQTGVSASADTMATDLETAQTAVGAALDGVQTTFGDTETAAGEMETGVSEPTDTMVGNLETARDNIGTALGDVQTAFDDTGIAASDQVEPVGALTSAMDDSGAAADNAVSPMEAAAQAIAEAGKAASTAIQPLDDTGEAMGNIEAPDLGSFASDLNAIARAADKAAKELEEFNKQAGGSRGNSPDFARRAAGGPVFTDRAYMVGEEGPEMFVPGGPGMIVPNHKLRGMAAGGLVNPGGASGEDASLDIVTQMLSALNQILDILRPTADPIAATGAAAPTMSDSLLTIAGALPTLLDPVVDQLVELGKVMATGVGLLGRIVTILPTIGGGGTARPVTPPGTGAAPPGGVTTPRGKPTGALPPGWEYKEVSPGVWTAQPTGPGGVTGGPPAFQAPPTQPIGGHVWPNPPGAVAPGGPTPPMGGIGVPWPNPPGTVAPPSSPFPLPSPKPPPPEPAPGSKPAPIGINPVSLQAAAKTVVDTFKSMSVASITQTKTMGEKVGTLTGAMRDSVTRSTGTMEDLATGSGEDMQDNVVSAADTMNIDASRAAGLMRGSVVTAADLMRSGAAGAADLMATQIGGPSGSAYRTYSGALDWFGRLSGEGTGEFDDLRADSTDYTDRMQGDLNANGRGTLYWTYSRGIGYLDNLRREGVAAIGGPGGTATSLHQGVVNATAGLNAALNDRGGTIETTYSKAVEWFDKLRVESVKLMNQAANGEEGNGGIVGAFKLIQVAAIGTDGSGGTAGAIDDVTDAGADLEDNPPDSEKWIKELDKIKKKADEVKKAIEQIPTEPKSTSSSALVATSNALDYDRLARALAREIAAATGNTYAMTINTNAPYEPIARDFAILEAQARSAT